MNRTNKWIINIEEGRFNLTLFLDLRKAFDTADHNILLKSLKTMGYELEHSETNLFADDTNLTCTTKLISEAQRKVNDDFLVLGIWLSANKLSANLVKIESMILATSPKFKPLETDYLGLIIDGNLTWKKYIDSF